MKRILLILAGILLAVGLFLGGYYARGAMNNRDQSKAMDTASEFVKLVAEKNPQSALDEFASEGFKASQTAEGLGEATKQLTEADTQFGEPSIYFSEGSALYLQTVGKEGSEDPNTSSLITIVLQNVDGAWKVDTASQN